MGLFAEPFDMDNIGHKISGVSDQSEEFLRLVWLMCGVRKRWEEFAEQLPRLHAAMVDGGEEMTAFHRLVAMMIDRARIWGASERDKNRKCTTGLNSGYRDHRRDDGIQQDQKARHFSTRSNMVVETRIMIHIPIITLVIYSTAQTGTKAMNKTARDVLTTIKLPTSESYGTNPEYKTLSETDADNIIHELACAGFVIVPKEPTLEMREAGHRKAQFSDDGLLMEEYVDQPNVCYRAMIAAAAQEPKP